MRTGTLLGEGVEGGPRVLSRLVASLAEAKEARCDLDKRIGDLQFEKGALAVKNT